MSTSPQYDIYYNVGQQGVPTIERTLTDDGGTAVDVSGATVTFDIEQLDGTDVDSLACGFSTDGTDGVVQFTLDTSIDTAGTYRAKFTADYGGGVVEYYPSNRWVSVRVEPAPATDA